MLYKLVAILFITLAVLGWYAIYSSNGPLSKKSELLFPKLAQQLPDLDTIIIKNKDETLKIVRNQDSWMLENHFPIAKSKVQDLIFNLNNLSLIELKTADAAKFPLINVNSLEDAKNHANSNPQQIILHSNAKDYELVNLIVGNSQALIGNNAADKDLQNIYVRQPSMKNAMLVKGNLNLTPDIKAWVDSSLMDFIAANNIKTLEINNLKFSREDKNAEFVCDDCVGLKHATDNTNINNFLNNLLVMEFSDVFVRPLETANRFIVPKASSNVTAEFATNIDWNTALYVKLTSFDNLQYYLAVAEVDGKYIAKVNSGLAPEFQDEYYQDNALVSRVKEFNFAKNSFYFSINPTEYSLLKQAPSEFLINQGDDSEGLDR